MDNIVPGYSFFAVSAGFSYSQQALDAFTLRSLQQPFSDHIQIRKSAGNKQPVGVLYNASVSHLAKSKYPFDYQKGILHFCPHPRFSSVLRYFFIAQLFVAAAFLIGKILRMRRMFAYDIALSRICRVAPYSFFIAMQKARQDLAVMHIGRGGNSGMYQLRAAVKTDMRLHAEIPLIAFFCLMHFRIAGIVFVLGGTRRIDNRGVDYGSACYLQPVLCQVFVYQLEEPFAEIVGFKDVAKLANRRLIRRRLMAKVYADEVAHGPGIVKSLFHSRVGQAEPVLQKMDPKHTLYADGRPSGALSLRIKRLYDLAKLAPWNDLIHIGEENISFCSLAVLLKAAFGKSFLAHFAILRVV